MVLNLRIKMKKVIDIYEKSFPQHRANQAIDTSQDLSRKASIDTYIRDLVNCFNQSENYFTTSSCSGRLIVFSQVHKNAF
jgi:tRNA(Phe) wybutosine-synthesizing methylase Tyw3